METTTATTRTRPVRLNPTVGERWHHLRELRTAAAPAGYRVNLADLANEAMAAGIEVLIQRELEAQAVS